MTDSGNALSRRRFLQWAATGAASASLAGCASLTRHIPGLGGKGKGVRPNIVIIFADDLGYQDLGCFGSPDIKTPNLDRMAAEGMKFTDFYAAAAVCSPSRAALLTGCYPPRVGITYVLGPEGRMGLHRNEVTIGDMLKSRGYATACIGKWHLGHLPEFLPTRHGFDHYFGLPYSNDMTVNRETGEEGVPLYRDEQVVERPVVLETLTQRYTHEAIQFIEKNKAKPFFLYFPHTFPHVPLRASKEFSGRSERGLYGDVVEELDWSVGQVMDTLKRLGLDDNTLVVFTSDNGPWLQRGKDGGSALPLRNGKGTPWEGGMREPTIMRWPGRIPAGSVCHEVAATIDFLPTVARLAGAKAPTDRIVDGRDIWPLMSGKRGAHSPHEAFYYYNNKQLHAVRSGDWKLMLAHRENAARESGGKKELLDVPDALYNLRDDIGETRDVAAEHPDVMKRLLGYAEKMRDDIGDEMTKRKGKNNRPFGGVEKPRPPSKTPVPRPGRQPASQPRKAASAPAGQAGRPAGRAARRPATGGDAPAR